MEQASEWEFTYSSLCTSVLHQIWFVFIGFLNNTYIVYRIFFSRNVILMSLWLFWRLPYEVEIIESFIVWVQIVNIDFPWIKPVNNFPHEIPNNQQVHSFTVAYGVYNQLTYPFISHGVIFGYSFTTLYSPRYSAVGAILDGRSKI